MDPATLRAQVSAFFDEFVEAFRTFDGEVIARRYLSPYSALHANGVVGFFATGPETADYFQKVVDNYHSQDCRSCRYKDLDMVPLGSESALGTVTWELLREDGSVLSCWRESYNLARVEGHLRVFASVDHVD